jgi:hypothetical protein
MFERRGRGEFIRPVYQPVSQRANEFAPTQKTLNCYKTYWDWCCVLIIWILAITADTMLLLDCERLLNFIHNKHVAHMQRSVIPEIEASNPWISQAASRLLTNWMAHSN